MKSRLLTVGFCLLCLLTGCQANPDDSPDDAGDPVSSSLDLFAMDTYIHLKVWCDDPDTAGKALQDGEARIQESEAMFSVTDPGSDVSRINQNAGDFTQIHPDTEIILETARQIHDESDGALSVSVYPVLKEWGFTTGDYKIPDPETIRGLLRDVDDSRILVQDHQVKIPGTMQIDFGALAKGYTGDQLIALFQEYGVESGLINLGGNVQTFGTKPDGALWTVGVVNPFTPDQNMCIVQIADKAVITSGNYERYFTGEDGKNYWHIIDPADGYPADNGLVSVTVIGESGLQCDALSTALFTMGTERATDYWKDLKNLENSENSENSDFEMILVTDDRKILVTEGMIESCYFENLSEFPVEVISYDAEA